MNLIFMRHGEATDNVKGLISDKEIYWSILTDKGIKDVLDSIQYLPDTIDKMYVSPFPRTLETASLINDKFDIKDVVIEPRIKEIYYGKYSHQKNNEELDNVRIKQVNGDYLTRFGDYGENKYDIESRLSSFLYDIYKNDSDKENILIVSHGSITSYMKRILEVESKHLETGKVQIFENVDFNKLLEHKDYLDSFDI